MTCVVTSVHISSMGRSMCHVEVILRVKVNYSFETMDCVNPDIHILCPVESKDSATCLEFVLTKTIDMSKRKPIRYGPLILIMSLLRENVS
jgi:hypothetical protein